MRIILSKILNYQPNMQYTNDQNDMRYANHTNDVPIISLEYVNYQSRYAYYHYRCYEGSDN